MTFRCAVLKKEKGFMAPKVYWLIGITFILVLFALTMGGCANQSGLTVKVDTVGGDFWARKVGSNNQMVDTGQTTLNANTPGVGSVPPIGLDWASTMQTKSSRIEIKHVSGSIYFESAGTDNQGVNIPDVLEKLYVPDDPFAFKEE